MMTKSSRDDVNLFFATPTKRSGAAHFSNLYSHIYTCLTGGHMTVALNKFSQSINQSMAEGQKGNSYPFYQIFNAPKE